MKTTHFLRCNAVLAGVLVAVMALAGGCDDVEYARSTVMTTGEPHDASDRSPFDVSDSLGDAAPDMPSPVGDADVYKGVTTGPECSSTVRVTLPAESEPYAELIQSGQSTLAESHEIIVADGTIRLTFHWSDGTLVSMAVDERTGEVIEQWISGSGCSQITMVRETADARVRTFEGTWEGDEIGGTFNFVVDGDWLEGTYDGTVAGRFTGTLEGEQVIVIDDSFGLIAEGLVGEDVAEGTWAAAGFSGTWRGGRTL
jgi:hypothetical protein